MIKTENGMATYQVGVAIENLSNIVVSATIQSNGAQVTTNSGEKFPAQLVKIAEDYGQIKDEDTEAWEVNLIPPYAMVIDEVHAIPGINISYNFRFIIPDSLTPTSLEVNGFPEIDLKGVKKLNQLEYSQPYFENQFPIDFITDSNIKVTINYPQQELSDSNRLLLKFIINIENLDKKNYQNFKYFWILIDSEGSLLNGNYDSPNLNHKTSLPLKPGEKVNGFLWTVMKDMEYYHQPTWESLGEIHLDDTVNLDGEFTVEGVNTTFDELRNGLLLDDGRKLTWYGNKRTRLIKITKFGGFDIRERLNLGDINFFAIRVDEQSYWATFKLP